MARIELNIRFFYQEVLYVEKQGYIPRHEAIKIPQLRVQQIETRSAATKKSFPAHKQTNKHNNGRSNQKYEQLDDELIDQNEDNELDNEMDMEEVDGQGQGQGEGQGQGQGQGQGEVQAQGQQDNQMGDIDVDEDQQPDISDQVEEAEENQFNQEQLDDEMDQSNQDNDLSEISRSLSPNMNYGKYKTKRQKGQLDNFLELPLKKQRKDAKKYDQATEILRKEQKQKKRKQYIKKLMEAQQKATFDKILNETGRKFRQREQRQQKQVKQKHGGKTYRTLGDVPKIITKQTSKGTQVSIHRTGLFSPNMMHEPNIKMSEECSVCHSNVGKYKTGKGRKFCSVACFKLIQNEKQNGGKMVA